MFELERRWRIFKLMAAKNPMLAQNIEILFQNRTLLDGAYHYPKEFILHLNNCFRATLSFVESSVKNSEPWLKECVSKFRDEHLDEYEILKHLRDVSMHQALVFPAESLVAGLYRIRSSKEYVLKLGLGDHGGPAAYSWDIAMSNSDEMFHSMLAFHSMMFVDLEHSCIGECLGLTRKWFFSVKFKNKRKAFDQVVDIYSLVCEFIEGLIDNACENFALSMGVENDASFKQERSDYNFVNTLLEVDLYPSLFEEWWGDEMHVLNYGVRYHRFMGDVYKNMDLVHKECYSTLSASPEAYLACLDKYAEMSDEEMLNGDGTNDVFSFIHLNHWHAKNCFPHALKDSAIDVLDVAKLQRLGRNYLNELTSVAGCTQYGHAFRSYLKELSTSIRHKLSGS